jgi:hypothetical protein
MDSGAICVPPRPASSPPPNGYWRRVLYLHGLYCTVGPTFSHFLQRPKRFYVSMRKDYRAHIKMGRTITASSPGFRQSKLRWIELTPVARLQSIARSTTPAVVNDTEYVLDANSSLFPFMCKPQPYLLKSFVAFSR